MPSRREHLRASKKLLGTANPWVHSLIDLPSPKKEHRYRHSPETVRLIVELLGTDENLKKEIRREGWLHLFMDWGWVDETDYKTLPVNSSERGSGVRRQSPTSDS